MSIQKILHRAVTLFLIAIPTEALVAEERQIGNSQRTPNSCKSVLGEMERLVFPALRAQITARVDTGATLSSISAHNIEIYTRRNQSEVQFDMATETGLISVKKPVQKFIEVRQQASRTPSIRPVVLLEVNLGTITGPFEFSLSDRTHLSSKALIGRNTIREVGVVDVSEQFLQSGVNGAKTMCDG